MLVKHLADCSGHIVERGVCKIVKIWLQGVGWAGIEELDLNIPPEAQEEMELLQVASADPGMESPEKSILLVLTLL